MGIYTDVGYWQSCVFFYNLDGKRADLSSYGKRVSQPRTPAIPEGSQVLAILLCAKAWQITFFYFTLNNLWVVFKYDNLSFFCCNSAGNLMMNVEPLIISIVSYHVNSKLYLVVFFLNILDYTWRKYFLSW